MVCWKWELDYRKAKKDGHNIICAIDEKLIPVFDGYKKELEFYYGFNDGKGEFIFCDSRNKNLRLGAEKIIAKTPKTLNEKWMFSIEH